MADGSVLDNSGDPKPLINEKGTIFGLLIPFMVVMWICVSLRFWSRTKLRCLGYDDAFVLIATAFSTVGSIFVCRATESGLGEHFSTIGAANVIEFQKNFYVSMVSYNVSTTFTKLCLLSQYIRMFDRTNPLWRWCWGFLVVAALWGAAFIIIGAVPCIPVSSFWHRGSGGHCYGFGSVDPSMLQRVYISQNATNVFLDLVVLAIPVPLYFEKTTPWRTRIGIGCLLLCGVVVNITSIWRLQTLIQTRVATYPVVDPTWYGPRSIVLAAIEVDLACICASIPVFWPVLTQSLGKIFVTQEVHVVHQHRRLSEGGDRFGDYDGCDGGAGDENYELRASETGGTTTPHNVSASSRNHSRGGSEASLKLMRSSSGRVSRQQQQQQNAPTPPPPPPVPGNAHYKDRFVASRVTPPGLSKDDGVSVSEAEIKSEGQKGFMKEQLRFGAAAAAAGDGGVGKAKGRGRSPGDGGGNSSSHRQHSKWIFEE